MVNRIEAEITALQADLAHTITWLRGDYLPSPLPPVVEDRLVKLTARFDVLRDLAEDREAAIAYARTRDQEAVPDEIVGRLIAAKARRACGASIAACRCARWRRKRGSALRRSAISRPAKVRVVRVLCGALPRCWA